MGTLKIVSFFLLTITLNILQHECGIIDKDNNIVLMPRDDLNISIQVGGDFNNETFQNVAELLSDKVFNVSNRNITEDETTETTTDSDEDDDDDENDKTTDPTWDTDMFPMEEEEEDNSPSELEDIFNKKHSEGSSGSSSSDDEDVNMMDKPSTSTERMSYIQKIPRKPKPSSKRRKRSSMMDDNEEDDEEDDYDRERRYRDNKRNENTELNWVSKVLTEAMYDYSPENTNNSMCRYHSKLYKANLRNLTLWALKMLDSSAVTPSGLLSANMYQLGNFDECISVNLPSTALAGKYCLASATFRPTLSLNKEYYNGDHSKDFVKPDQYGFVWDAIKDNIDPAKIPRNKFYWALCIPSSCTAQDVRGTLQEALTNLLDKYQIHFEVSLDEKHCYTNSDHKLPKGFWVFSFILLFIIALVSVATFYDVFIFRRSDSTQNKSIKKWLIPFSGLSNMEKLGAKNESEEFSVMHGLKAICMCQIIIGHRNMNVLGNVTFNPEFTEEKSSQLVWAYFNNGTLVVDTFFLIGGFLTFYFIFFELEKRQGKINYFVVFLYRFIRVTPVYAFVIFFYIFILPYMNDGPLWRDIIGRETSRCEHNWWSNLLYINNYYHENDQCMVQSWYLSCDFHFFIVGTFITYLVWRFQRHAFYILAIVLITCIMLPFSFVFNNRYWGHYRTFISQMYDPPSHPEFQSLYIKSHLRAIPYAIGIILAFVYIKLKENKFKFSTKSLWTISIIAALAGHLPYLLAGLQYIPGRPYYRLENALFNPFQRLVWALCMGWIILGHGTNGFGPISRILGHRIFIPFSRLTFCAYLIHVAVQLTSIASMRVPTYVSYTGLILGVCGDLMFTFACAFLLNIMIESPLDRFQKKVIKSLIGGITLGKKENKGVKEEIIDAEFQKGIQQTDEKTSNNISNTTVDNLNGTNIIIDGSAEHCHL